jgi:hypothetical protein
MDPEQTHRVRYFERALVEYHPEVAGIPFEVPLGRIGSYFCYGAPEPPDEATPTEEETPAEEPADKETPTEEPTVEPAPTETPGP